jgi:hypothetical protein
MNSLELQLCAIQGRLFELSLASGYASDVFAPAYMRSTVCALYDEKYNRMQWCGEEYLMEEFADEYPGLLAKKGELYSKDALFWIGYTYRYWHFITGENSKAIYRQAPVKTMKLVYPGFHTLSEEMAIENLQLLHKEKRHTL